LGLPIFLLGLPAGSLADIVDRRKLLPERTIAGHGRASSG